MQELAKHGVYTKVPLAECWKETGAAPIGTRWVDVNKGDKENPDYNALSIKEWRRQAGMYERLRAVEIGSKPTAACPRRKRCLHHKTRGLTGKSAILSTS